jgi:ATP-binding cassette subfamily B protein
LLKRAEQQLSPGRRRAPAWWTAVSAVGRAEPRLAAIAVITTVLCSVTPAVFIVVSGLLAGLLARPGGPGNTGRLTVLIVVLAVVLALSQVISVAREGVLEALARRMDVVLRRRLIEALARPAGVGHLEDPGLQRRIAVAQGVANRLGGPAGGLLGMAGRAQVLLSGAACAALLGWVQPVLAVALVAVSLAGAWWLRREYFRLVTHMHLDPGMLRRSQHLRDVLITPGAEKEVRVFGLGRWFMGQQHDGWLRVATAAWRDRHVSWPKIAAGAVVFGAEQAVTFAVLAAGWRSGSVSITGLVIGVQASIGLLQFAAVTEWDRLVHIGWEAVDALVEVEDVVRPMAPPPGRDPGLAPVREIEFRDVRFQYPDGTPVLRGVSLTITAGSSAAIVGRNGAGKSTLLKLLMRDYEPTGGTILVDGVPLADLDPVLWRTRVAAMAQDFLRLPLSARENVTGPGASQPDGGGELADAATRAGLAPVVSQLPGGWDTVLSRQIRGGTDLSGGQWQKVALARALYSLRTGARLLALDEPTANMDIEAEHDVYNTVIDATAGRTLVLVSHRFATVRRVDRIFVLDDGRITESGDHTDLMGRGGLYAEMFNAQAAVVR